MSEDLCLPIEAKDKQAKESISGSLRSLFSDESDAEQRSFACKNRSSDEDGECRFSQQMESRSYGNWQSVALLSQLVRGELNAVKHICQ